MRSHGSDYKEFYILGYDAMNTPTFRRILLLPSSGYKN